MIDDPDFMMEAFEDSWTDKSQEERMSKKKAI